MTVLPKNPTKLTENYLCVVGVILETTLPRPGRSDSESTLEHDFPEGDAALYRITGLQVDSNFRRS